MKEEEPYKLEENQDISEKKNEKNNEKIENNDERISENPIIEKVDTNEELLIKKNIGTKEKKRYFGIDFIRVLACYLVMQTHAGELYYIGDGGVLLRWEKNLWPGIFNSLARICVPLFVMIYGYLLLPMKTDYSTFLKKRFTRVSFPFIIFCILYDVFFISKEILI